jgi:hypothetical protein
MNIFYIILFTLLIESLISTIIYIVSGENEDVLCVFGLGIFGLTLLAFCRLFQKINKLFKYHIGKRAIFEEEATGNRFKCKVKDASDVDWLLGYRLIKRYATKVDWKDVPDLSKELLELSRNNCSNCKYDKECKCDFPYTTIKCKHDDYGMILDFDKFEKL